MQIYDFQISVQLKNAYCIYLESAIYSVLLSLDLKMVGYIIRSYTFQTIDVTISQCCWIIYLLSLRGSFPSCAVAGDSAEVSTQTSTDTQARAHTHTHKRSPINEGLLGAFRLCQEPASQLRGSDIPLILTPAGVTQDCDEHHHRGFPPAAAVYRAGLWQHLSAVVNIVTYLSVPCPVSLPVVIFPWEGLINSGR